MAEWEKIGKNKWEQGKMHQYPSDNSREEYKLIREDLEGAKKTTRPRKYDLYDVFCMMCFVQCCT